MIWKLFFVLLFIVVIFVIYVNLPKIEKYEDKKSVNVYLFFAEWCGHCERYLKSGMFMKTYDDLKKDDKYKNVIFKQIDFDKNKEMANKYNIGGFPTIISTTEDGTLIKEFSGDRNSSSDLKEFVDNSLNH
jgi:thiol-disulfide isomerase/thioredoxin